VQLISSYYFKAGNFFLWNFYSGNLLCLLVY